MTGLIVGREDALAEVDRFVSGVDDCPATLVIEGDAGIGKTTVWRSGLETAERFGARLLVARPAGSETALAYSGLADLLAGVDSRSWDELPTPQRQALDVALLRDGGDGHVRDPRAIFAGFGGVLRLLARDAPVLVAVDDRQWLDLGSWRALEYVARRLDGEPVRLLATSRPEGTRSWLSTDAVLRLAGLTPGALHGLIKTHMGVHLSRPSVLRVHRMTGGNPFFALQLTSVLVEAGLPAATEPWPVPDDLREIVASRLGMLPARVRATLLTAAATSRPSVSGLDGPSLRAAETAGIVTIAGDGRVRFAHPLFASAIYDSATSAERRRVHTKLADESHDAEETARHRALACDGPDEKVAKLLDRAAEAARRRGAPDAAAELAERASGLTPSDRPRSRWERGVAAAELHFHAGDLLRARALLLELTDSASPDWEVSRAWTLLGETSYRLGFVQDGVEFLRRAVDTAGDDATLAARAEIALGHALFSASGGFPDAAVAQAYRRGVAMAETVQGDRALLAYGLSNGVISELYGGHGVDQSRLERALALEDLDLPMPVERRPSYIAALIWTHEEQFDRARTRCKQLVELLSDRGEHSELPYLFAELARLECLAGNLTRAGEYADRGYEHAHQAGSDSLASVTRGMRAWVYAHQGHTDNTRAAATDAITLADRSGWRLGAFWAAQALALLELSVGNDESVLEVLGHWLGLVEQGGVVDLSRRRFVPDAIEAMVRLGQLERADALTQRLYEGARALGRPSAVVAAARCCALIGAARGDVRTALDDLAGALRDTPTVPVPLELARSLILKGQLERRSKHKREAATSLQAAEELCDRVGATLWAQRARIELERLGRPTNWGELTSTEARIAAFVASGLTNREVTAAAFVSVNTVEANMSRIYRKLAIHSRAELGAWLAERGRPQN